tara:strand:- start:1440 stop:1652 length:213 start_codon:yes stop_codon:yes gene_type:complete
MSLSKSKNFERRLRIIEDEAKSEINKVCKSSLWETLGLIYFDQLDDIESIKKANFYYGQLSLVKELKTYI